MARAFSMEIFVFSAAGAAAANATVTNTATIECLMSRFRSHTMPAMRRLIVTLLIILAASSASAAPYKVIRHIAIGGTGGWDYVAVDADARRVYQSHSDRV